MSVRRCTYRHRHTTTLAAPSGVRGTACRPAKAESQLQSESLRPPPPPPPTPTPPQTRRRRSPGYEGHHLELECRRFARHQTLLNPVLGESLEDLHCAELECQRFAQRKTTTEFCPKRKP